LIRKTSVLGSLFCEKKVYDPVTPDMRAGWRQWPRMSAFMTPSVFEGGNKRGDNVKSNKMYLVASRQRNLSGIASLEVKKLVQTYFIGKRLSRTEKA
jgi:hypothetical protein